MSSELPTITPPAAPASIGPIVRLYCCCCGGQTYGRQWSNRDTGYGLCRNCIPRCLAAESRDRAPSEPLWYGVRGVHFDCPEEVELLAADELRFETFLRQIRERNGG